MKGSMVELYRLFASIDREIVIPVYQRNYDWKHKHCERLLEDLMAVIKEDRPKHFFGAVVVHPETTFKLVLIDGQQRLTTVSLLILALIRLIESGQLESTSSRLSSSLRKYLVKEDAASTATVRLKPVKSDAEAYERLFNPEQGFIASSNLTSNYEYFVERLPQLSLTAEQIWEAIARLEVMHLDLERHDAPQRIFESLNSTGLALSEADKVRNLVLMDLPTAEQNRVYDAYWNRIEINVDYDTDEFLRWYLVTKTSTTPNISAVYESFNKFATKQGTKGANLLADVRDYSEHYRAIRHSSVGTKSIDRRLRRLNILKSDVVLPFLMPLIGELRAGTASADDVAETIAILESYLFRRIVCDVPTNTLNKLFAGMYREIRGLRGDEDSFSEVFAYALLRRDGNARFPSDDEFRSSFEHRNMYRINRDRRLYLFECLENGNSRDALDIANRLDEGEISVEHVMPQTLTTAWQASLGENADEVHSEWLHRIGNLTVTGYNSTYSNLSFVDKRDHPEGFAASPYRLNHLIRQADTWTINELKLRSRTLSGWALDYWRFPTTQFQPPKKLLSEMPLGEDTDFTRARVVAFNFNGIDRPVSSWRDLTAQVIRMLDDINHEAVFEAAQHSIWFTAASELPDHQLEIVPGLSMDMNNNTWTKTQQLRLMFGAVGISPDDLILYFPVDEAPGQTTASHSDAEDGDEALLPYSELTAFIELFEERSAQRLEASDNAELVDQFLSAMGPHQDADFSTTLGVAPLEFSTTPSLLDEATASQLLALMSAKVVEQQSFNPIAIHAAIMDGQLRKWLVLLKSAGSSL